MLSYLQVQEAGSYSAVGLSGAEIEPGIGSLGVGDRQRLAGGRHASGRVDDGFEAGRVFGIESLHVVLDGLSGWPHPVDQHG